MRSASDSIGRFGIDRTFGRGPSLKLAVIRNGQYFEDEPPETESFKELLKSGKIYKRSF